MSSSTFTVETHILPCQYVREYPGATLDDQEDTLHLHVKRYTPLDANSNMPGAVTVIAAHANGFPKELYEPLWDDVYRKCKQTGLTIRSIWIADVVNQGQSAVLNEDKLGNDPSWFDFSRDYLLMINHFRKEMPRPLVGIGHSMGGAILANLSLMHPRLLSTLILIDPVIQRAGPPRPAPGMPSYFQMSTFRRDIWPTRAEAIASFKRSKFYQSWDPRVLDAWFQHGLRESTPLFPEVPARQTGDLPVTLTTPKHQEAFTFIRPNLDGLDSAGKQVINRATHADLDPTARDTYPYYRPETVITFNNLPHLKPSVLYIFGGKSDLSPPDWRRQKMEATGVGVGGSGGAKDGRVQEVVIEERGHLVPFEAVDHCAHAVVAWLVPEMENWQNEEERFAKAWSQITRKDKTTTSEDWKRMVGGDPRAKVGKL